MAALDRRWSDAVVLYTDASRGLRELQVNFDLGLVLLAAAALAPVGDPFGQAAREESAAIFTQLGSQPFLAQHRALLDARPTVPSSPPDQIASTDQIASADPIAAPDPAPPA